MTSDQVAGNIFVAGFGDGAVRVFDQRLKPTTSMVKVWREHKQWITNVHMQRGGLRELVSGSRNGEIRLWDLRMDDPISTTYATSDTLRTLSVHEHAPVFSVYGFPSLSIELNRHINFFCQGHQSSRSQDVQCGWHSPIHVRALHELPPPQPVFPYRQHCLPPAPYHTRLRSA